MMALAGLLVAAVSLVTALDVAVHVGQARQTWADLRAERVIGHLVQGAQHLAFERGRTNVVLRADPPVSPENRAFLDERRRQVDRELAAAIRLLDDQNVALARKVSRQVQVLTELRQRADALMRLPRAQRDPLFADQWFNALSAQLNGVPESIFLLGGDGSLPPMARVALYAFDLRNALGVESSRIAAALGARQVPDAAQMHELARLRGQGDAAWASLRREAVMAANPVLSDALVVVDREVYRNFRPVQDAVLHAFANQRLPQETMPYYAEVSVPALDSAASVMTLAAQEGVIQAEQASERASLAVALRVCILMVCLGLGAGLLVLALRLGRDLGGLRLYLHGLADGRLDAAAPAAPADREIADMAEVAAILRRHLQERRRIEASLLEMSRNNRLVLDHASDGLIALDAGGATLFANPAAQRMTGWSFADLEGRSHHHLIHHSRADGSPNPSEDCPVHQSLADGQPRHVAEDLFWRKDGSSFPVEMSVAPWTDNGQRGVVVAFRDISDRKRAEDRNQELMDELRRSNAELESFAYAVSHDLQAPLRTVAGFVGLTRRALADRLDDRTAEFMDFAEQGAQRMGEIIAALLDYARVGTRGEPPRPVAVGAVLSVVLADLAPAIAERQAQVVVDEVLPWVMADPVQLGSVLQNLVGNALKYTGSANPPRIQVNARVLGRQATIVVSDNGPGVPAEQREQIFGLFKRGGSHEGIEGLGMGLAICRRVLDRLGGKIRVEDAPGGGAAFVVTLPVAEGTGVTT